MATSKRKSLKTLNFVFVFIVLFLGLFLVGKYTIPRFPFGPYSHYTDLTAVQKADLISYTHLTNEDSHPFVYADVNYPFNLFARISAKKRRDVAIEKFPDTRSCIIIAMREPQKPDLRLLDWDSFQSLEEVNVCLWRIFSSLETPEKVEKWFYFQNVKSISSRPVLNQEHYTTDYIVGHHMIATWSIRGDKSFPYPSKGIRLFKDGALSQTVGFTCFWDDSGKLRSVSSRWGVVL